MSIGWPQNSKKWWRTELSRRPLWPVVTTMLAGPLWRRVPRGGANQWRNPTGAGVATECVTTRGRSGAEPRLSHVAWLPTRCWAVGRWRTERETPPPLPPGLGLRLQRGLELETEPRRRAWLRVSAPHLRRQEPRDFDRVCGSWRQSWGSKRCRRSHLWTTVGASARWGAGWLAEGGGVGRPGEEAPDPLPWPGPG